ncbi:MAG TPA: YrbL family protein [Lysobacter sp.]|nr:YrbL family protein [Lysobacter sp.]
MRDTGDARRWHGMALIAAGTHRVCVLDPDDPRCCLKFERPLHERPPAGPRERLRRAFGRRFPRFGDNATEWRAWRRLHARFGDALDERFARCEALVQMPHGLALRQRCVTDADGAPAPSLYRLLFERPRHPADALCAAVDRFEAWLLANAVPLFDLNAGNFVVVERDGALQLVCIDSKSLLAGKELLPLSRWSRTLLRRKIARRAARLRQRIRDALATPTSAP